MTTCPQCGRVAGDEFVCADCGMSLALARRTAAVEAAQAAAAAAELPSPGLLDEFGSEEAIDGDPERDVTAWRLAAIVCITCVVAAVTAIVLLHQHGSPDKQAALPFTTSSGAGSTTPAVPSSSSGAPSTRASSTKPTKPTRTPTPTASRSKSASPKPSSTAPRSTASRTSLASSTRTVRAAKGSPDPDCGPHCYRLVVSVSGFSSGQHRVSCWSGHDGQFASYLTSATVSDSCAFRRPNDVVWAVVDGTYKSNSVTW
jgi:hypothetical protein